MSVPFIGPSYQLRRKKADSQRLVNMCVTNIESGAGKGGSKVFLQSIPGLTHFSQTAFAITKTQAAISLTAGATQTYTVVVTNQGPRAADGGVVKDTLPTGFTFTACTIAYAGGTTGPASATAAELVAGVTLTAWPVDGAATLTITGTFAAVGTYVNTATALVGDARALASVTTTVVAAITGLVFTSGGTSTSNNGTLPTDVSSQILPGDYLVAVIYYDGPLVTATLTGYTLIAVQNDSAGSGTYRFFGRLADGTSADNNTAFSRTTVAGNGGTSDAYVYAFAAVRAGTEASFPVGFSGWAFGGSALSFGAATDRITISFAGAESVAYSGAPFTYNVGTSTWTQIANDNIDFTDTETSVARHIQMLTAYTSASTTLQAIPTFGTSGSAGGGGQQQLTIGLAYTP